jgi:effector-binding domain-containing protein
MKKTIFGILIGLSVLLLGYLFIYPYDYTVRFKANTFPGPINQYIKQWHKKAGVEGTEVTQEDLLHLESLVQAGDSVHRYHWSIEPLTDSTSRVTVRIKDRDHSLKNKLLVPFTEAEIEKLGVSYVTDFAEDLKDHIDLFRVHIDGEAELPSTYYAYVNIKSSQYGKAGGMMANYALLNDLLAGNGATMNGPPMIIVNEWDREKDSLDFNFCFPIIRSDRLPRHPKIQYKRIFPKKAIKATYNGNYLTSDRAWYALLDYAEKNGIEVEPTPVEVFHNNPSAGGNALRWRAEIYLPVKVDYPVE